jgi:hypothetical protein
MKSQTLKIPKTRTLVETCAGRMNDIPKTNNCVAPPEIYGNMSQNANQFDLLLIHSPFVAIYRMILVIIGASQSTLIIQCGKKVVMMPSPTMSACIDLVLAAHGNESILHKPMNPTSGISVNYDNMTLDCVPMPSFCGNFAQGTAENGTMTSERAVRYYLNDLIPLSLKYKLTEPPLFQT